MPVSGEFHNVPIASITISPNRQRREVDKDSQEFLSLCGSLRARGLINPIILRRDHSLVAGERRLTAATALGWPSIQAQYLDELEPYEAYIAELEENVQRKDLSWQETAIAVAEYHRLRRAQEESWTTENTEQALSLGVRQIQKYLHVVSASQRQPELMKSDTLSRALTSIKRREDRALVAEMDIIHQVQLAPPKAIVTSSSSSPSTSSASRAPSQSFNSSVEEVILKQSFLSWAPTYQGPRFNLLHCDFPYGINIDESGQMGTDDGVRQSYDDDPSIYFNLIDCLVQNVDRLLLPTAHAMFWFPMSFYQDTKELLSTIFQVNPYPLFWMKSDGRGVLPDAKRGGRRIYETAFLLTRGDRMVVKPVANAIAAPTVGAKSFHISVKPVPVLQHFMGMLVDEFTELLDPTSGSGTAIIAATRLRAKRCLGMDIEDYYVTESRRELQREYTKAQLAKQELP